MPGAHTPENGNRNTVLFRRGSADSRRKNTTTSTGVKKTGAPKGTMAAAKAEVY